MLRLSDIIWAFWGFNCASNFVFFGLSQSEWVSVSCLLLRPFLFCKRICKVPRCEWLKILVPKHLWKSKIGPLQLILATKHYVTFFFGSPCTLYKPALFEFPTKCIISPSPIHSLIMWYSSNARAALFQFPTYPLAPLSTLCNRDRRHISIFYWSLANCCVWYWAMITREFKM